MYQTTAPIAPGSSGGGLFDLKGRLVGITTLLLTDAQNIGFAIPADGVGEALTKVGLESSRALVRAAVLIAAGKREEARPALETAVRKEPRLAVAWLALGDLMIVGGDREEGYIRQATEANPSLKEAWLALGREYGQRGTTAEVGYPDARSADPVQARIYRGKEIEALTRALALDPADLEVALDLADRYRGSGLLDAAEVLAKQVLASEPTNRKAWNIVGDAYEKRGQHSLAYEAYRKVINQPASTSSELSEQGNSWMGLFQIALAGKDMEEASNCGQEANRLYEESNKKFSLKSLPVNPRAAERDKQAKAALALLQMAPQTQ